MSENYFGNVSSTTPLLKSTPQSDSISEHRRRNYGSSSVDREISDQPNNNGYHNNYDGTDNNIPTPTVLSENLRSTLSFIQKIGFGLGHIYNDLCAGVWFSYTLLFLQAVLLLPAIEAGALVMLGQVCDAIATPIIGLLADRFGTKRQWHIFGTILVFLSFPMIFSWCPWCTKTHMWWPPAYFSIFIVLFQFAWACVQITHLSMIPEMSITQKDRSDLTATRYAASICSSIVVYVITWFMLKTRIRTNGDSDNIGPKDAFRFRDISLILTLIGLTMTVLFHFSLALSGYERRRLYYVSGNLNVEEGRSQNQQKSIRSTPSSSSSSPYTGDEYGETSTASAHDSNNDDAQLSSSVSSSQTSDSNEKLRKPIQHINFFKTKELYQNGLLYVFARLFMTTSMVYMPLWLDERSWTPSTPTEGPFRPDNKNLDDILNENTGFLTPSNILAMSAAIQNTGVEHLATVPLVSFLSSFVTSMILKQINYTIGHRISYILGSLIGLSGCIWIAIAASSQCSIYVLYSIAILFGAGSSITMISSLCITADMIGGHTYQGGFIYSAVTFADKLITGIVIVIIESLKCKNRSDCPEYYRSILAYGCGLAAILGILVLLTLLCNRRQNSDTNTTSSNIVI